MLLAINASVQSQLANMKEELLMAKGSKVSKMSSPLLEVEYGRSIVSTDARGMEPARSICKPAVKLFCWSSRQANNIDRSNNSPVESPPSHTWPTDIASAYQLKAGTCI